MIDQLAEQFQGGRIDPVQVFHNKQDGLLRSNAQQDRQEVVQGLLLLLFGRQVQGDIVGGQREGEEGGKEGQRLCQ